MPEITYPDKHAAVGWHNFLSNGITSLRQNECTSLERPETVVVLLISSQSNPVDSMVASKNSSFAEIANLGGLSSDGVFVYEVEEKRFLYLNHGIEKIFEINIKLISEEPEIILHAVPQVDRDYLETRKSELFNRGIMEDVQVRISNQSMEKVISCSAYLSSDKQSVVGFIKDITKAKQFEEYLINFGAKKDAILDSVSQSLATPLNLSRFTLDLIGRAVEEKKFDKVQAHLGLIREVTTDCMRIIEKFLREEHLASPEIDPKANRFDAIEKVLVVLEKLKEAYPKKQFRMDSPHKHLIINGDDLKFFQAVHNLLSNAIKFTHEKGIIEVIIKEAGGWLSVAVRDNGIGIPEHLKPFLFEKNSRASRPGLNGARSNGIGLYVVRQLATLMKGRITFESKENEGATFTLELPTS